MSKPFSDFKFCSTSVPSDIRSEISTKIKAMGGTHSSNLMSDVNILIVGDRNTEKFKFSVKNRYDIKFIKPDAILNIHSIWLNNEDQSNPNLLKIENYLLPIFENFSICLSRISNDQHFNSVDKQQLVNLITENGGTVSDSLTTTSSCVITNEKSGKRYEMAKKWQIPIIHPLWLLDSLKRKATLDFDYYNLELVKDVSKIGEGSCMVWDDLLKRKVKKKIRIEDQNDIPEPIKKDSKIWDSIMQFDNNNSKQSKANRNESSWDDNDYDDDDDADGHNNALPIKLEVSKSNLNHFKTPDLPKSSRIMTPIVTSNLFKDLTFHIKLFSNSKKSTLSKVIESHSGQIVDDDKSPSFIIIPSDYPSENLMNSLSSIDDGQLFTEWFIERCLHYKCIKADHWGKPFYHKNIENLPNLNLSITGFQGIELLHITKMISLLNFKFHESLNNDRDLLILNVDILNIERQSQLFRKFPSLFGPKLNHKANINSTKKKIKFAKQQNIPIVSITYLFTIFQDMKMTNINQRDWCIYCPKLTNLKPKLKQIVDFDSNDNKDDNKDNDKNNDKVSTDLSLTKQPSLPKLPSPIRNKRKDNWGRLVGKASKSQLDSLEMEQHDRQSQQLPNDYSQNSTQISYGQSETNVKLLKLLNRENEDPGKKRNENNNNEPPRKRTRAGYKEMLNVLDDN